MNLSFKIYKNKKIISMALIIISIVPAIFMGQTKIYNLELMPETIMKLEHPDIREAIVKPIYKLMSIYQLY